MRCGTWVEVYTTSWPLRSSRMASTALPSIGTMHWRAVRYSRSTTTAARSLTDSKSPSAEVVRKRLSPHSSWTRGASGRRAARLSVTAGSASRSSSTASAMSSASARVGAMHSATHSPAKRTLPRASGGWSEGLYDGRLDSARIGCTPSMSPTVNTRPAWRSGTVIDRMRAWARGLRTNAASHSPGNDRSPTNCAFPARCRASSLRGTRAPIPVDTCAASRDCLRAAVLCRAGGGSGHRAISLAKSRGAARLAGPHAGLHPGRACPAAGRRRVQGARPSWYASAGGALRGQRHEPASVEGLRGAGIS